MVPDARLSYRVTNYTLDELRHRQRLIAEQRRHLYHHQLQLQLHQQQLLGQGNVVFLFNQTAEAQTIVDKQSTNVTIDYAVS